MDDVTGRAWFRVFSAAAGLAVALAGCARTPPALSATPPASPSTPTVSPSASGPPTPSTVPSGSATKPTTSPSAPATSGPAVKAGGSLKLFAPASKKLTGSCQNRSGAPTLAVADKKNDFFNTIDATLVLAAGKKSVAKLTIALGEDSELIKRTLSYDATKRVGGTSAALSVNGSTYKVTGKLANVEDGKAAGTIPVTLTVTCASTNW